MPILVLNVGYVAGGLDIMLAFFICSLVSIINTIYRGLNTWHLVLFIGFVGQIYKKLCNTSINYCIEISFPLCLVEPSILDKLSKENRIVNCCHVPRGSGINFDENFRIIPCNHFADYPFSDTPVDPLKPSSIEEILSADIVKRFRHLARSYPALKCQSCNLWEQCGGGCFTRWLSLDPNDYIK